MPPTLSVVVPTYRRPALLRKTLESLRTQRHPNADFEVVVVDDASGDETVDVLEDCARLASNLRWVTQPVNRGPAAARNRGVGLARAPLILFMDDDIVASPDLVHTHIRVHAGTADTHGVVGLVEWLPALRLTPFMRWLEHFSLQFAFTTMTEGRQDDAAGAFYTCNLSMKRALFESVGGFDERFPFAAFEDTELALRLVPLGFELHFDRSALAWNSRPVTLDEFCARMTKVAQSSHVIAEIDSQRDLVVGDLTEPRYSRLQLVALHALSVIAPHLFGHSPREAYYYERIRRAYRAGLDLGRPASR